MKGRLNRPGLFSLFLICGLIIQPFPIIYLQGTIKTMYLVGLPIVFLLIATSLHRNKKLEKYFPISLAFFTSSLAFTMNSLGPYSTGPGTTMESRVFRLLLSALLIVTTIIIMTKISGNDFASIFLRKGNLKLGLIIGLATFLFFLITALPASTLLFGGREVTQEQLVTFAPWIAAFVFANALREELWFRGLFLKKYESFLGTDPSNLLQAAIFSLAHLTPALNPVYLIITFFLGLGFGATMQKTDSALGSILFHAGADIPVVLSVFSVL